MKKIAGITVLNEIDVASFAEAWIENFIAEAISFMKSSPPSRRRGLKRFEKLENLKMRKVASFAEAWIENFSLT